MESISFLQSKDWQKFQESLGRETLRTNNENFLLIKHNLPLGKSYFYCPRPRVLDSRPKPRKLFRLFLEEVRSKAEKEKVIFFRIEPEIDFVPSEFSEFGFKKGKDIQPRETIILDITKREEELLRKMHSKTRYNIRLAVRKGVDIKCQPRAASREIKGVFWGLLKKTAKRDKFKIYPKYYYEKLLGLPMTEIFLAEYRRKIIAANVMVFFRKRATYLFGASSNEYRNVMAPYLLQWEAIKEAKKRGFEEYDFWGISESRWSGVTRFKKGFGGKEVKYIGAYDLVFQSFWYRAYRFLKNIL